MVSGADLLLLGNIAAQRDSYAQQRNYTAEEQQILSQYSWRDPEYQRVVERRNIADRNYTESVNLYKATENQIYGISINSGTGPMNSKVGDPRTAEDRSVWGSAELGGLQNAAAEAASKVTEMANQALGTRIAVSQADQPATLRADTVYTPPPNQATIVSTMLEKAGFSGESARIAGEQTALVTPSPFRTYYAAAGDRTQVELRDTRAAVDRNSGEIGFYQVPVNPNTGLPRTGIYGKEGGGILIGGGSRAAAQSGMFSQGVALTPDIRTQWNPDKYAETANPALAAIIRASPGEFSRLGAEAYNGIVQRLDGRRLGPDTKYGRFPEWTGNLANLVDPAGANLSKAEYAGARIPWSIPLSSPDLMIMGLNGIEGPAPRQAYNREASMTYQGDLWGVGSRRGVINPLPVADTLIIGERGGTRYGPSIVSPAAPSAIAGLPAPFISSPGGVAGKTTVAPANLPIPIAAAAGLPALIQNGGKGIDIFGAWGGFERSVFQVGPVNIADQMRNPVLETLNPGFRALNIFTGLPGAQWKESSSSGEINAFMQAGGTLEKKSAIVKGLEDMAIGLPRNAKGEIIYDPNVPSQKAWAQDFQKAIDDQNKAFNNYQSLGSNLESSGAIIRTSKGFEITDPFAEGYRFGEYSRASDLIGRQIQALTGLSAPGLEKEAFKSGTRLEQMFVNMAGATVLRDPGQLPVAAAQGLMIAPLFEAASVGAAFKGAEVGARFGAGRTGAQVGEFLGGTLPVLGFGALGAAAVTGGFLDYSPEGMSRRAGSIAPSAIAMVAPSFGAGKFGEVQTRIQIMRDLSPNEKEFANAIMRGSNALRGQRSDVQNPLQLDQIKYLKGAERPVEAWLGENPHVLFGGSVFSTQMKVPGRTTADLDIQIFRDPKLAARELAARMGAPFSAENNLVIRGLENADRTPHAVDIHQYGAGSQPAAMAAPSSPIQTSFKISEMEWLPGPSRSISETLSMQGIRNAASVLGGPKEGRWQLYPPEHRAVKDTFGLVTSSEYMSKVLRTRATTENPISAYFTNRRAADIEKMVSTVRGNPFTRDLYEQGLKLYGKSPEKALGDMAPPQIRGSKIPSIFGSQIPAVSSPSSFGSERSRNPFRELASYSSSFEGSRSSVGSSSRKAGSSVESMIRSEIGSKNPFSRMRNIEMPSPITGSNTGKNYYRTSLYPSRTIIPASPLTPSSPYPGAPYPSPGRSRVPPFTPPIWRPTDFPGGFPAGVPPGFGGGSGRGWSKNYFRINSVGADLLKINVGKMPALITGRGGAKLTLGLPKKLKFRLPRF